jgi:SAM-dependent methyltransferase
MVGTLRRLLSRKLRIARQTENTDEAAIRKYLQGGRRPWSEGYSSFKNHFISRALGDRQIMSLFQTGQPLPSGYGLALDERVVEFPWALSQLEGCGNRVLDAGSTFNRPFILDHPAVKDRNVVILTLAPEAFHLKRANVSYLYGDLRDIVLRDACMDAVVCISTLEHIGMDNTMLYTRDSGFNECNLTDYLKAVSEFRRVLAPGGLALITVPFGKRENHGWQQQFDRRGVDDIVGAFGGGLEEARYYRYLPAGWVLASATECADCEYFNVHARTGFDADNAAAARAVACLRLRRP